MEDLTVARPIDLPEAIRKAAPRHDGDSAAGAGIALEAVTKGYGPVTALDGVDIDLPLGAMTCLAGPNGSGKTTAFRLIAGLTRPDAGTVSVPSAPVGISFQRASAYPDLTAGENLRIFADLGGGSAEWRSHLVMALGLEPALHRPVADLSDGFAKKLDLALALVKRPAICLLDEPLADLDEHTRQRVVALLEHYAGDGRLIVVASHRIERFAGILDRLIVLRDGRVRLDRSVTEVTDGPAAAYRRAVRGND